jgi:hypothetical protein
MSDVRTSGGSWKVRLGAAGLVMAAVSAPAAAGAGRPDLVSFPVDVTYEVTELTDLCGIEVWFRLEGTFKGTLFRDRRGTVVGEFDSQPNTWLTLYSPETGESISNPFATTFHNRYPEGTDPGDLVVATATGFNDKLPGLRAGAGRMYFPDGEVIEVVDGIPYVTYGEPASFTGSQFDYDEADAAICAELAGG